MSPKNKVHDEITCSNIEIGRYLRATLRVASHAGVPPRLVRGRRAEEDKERIETHKTLPEMNKLKIDLISCPCLLPHVRDEEISC